MASFTFRVDLCRIRLFPTSISNIKWLGSELPLRIVKSKWHTKLFPWRWCWWQLMLVTLWWWKFQDVCRLFCVDDFLNDENRSSPFGISQPYFKFVTNAFRIQHPSPIWTLPFFSHECFYHVYYLVFILNFTAFKFSHPQCQNF